MGRTRDDDRPQAVAVDIGIIGGEAGGGEDERGVFADGEPVGDSDGGVVNGIDGQREGLGDGCG